MKLLIPFVTIAVLLGAAQIVHEMRTHAMRALAERLGFRYIGPPWKLMWKRHYPIAHPPVPTWISSVIFAGNKLSGLRITRVVNVIEGEKDGLTVLVFDVILGEGKGSQPCTLIACQTEQNPFGVMASVDRVVQTHEWTIVHGPWVLWFSWAMRVKRIEQHIGQLNPR